MPVNMLNIPLDHFVAIFLESFMKPPFPAEVSGEADVLGRMH